MIGLSIKFDLGRYHANPWGSHVNDAATEWPPSPWRLLRALYSVGRTHSEVASRQDDLDGALAALASAPPPVFELPPVAAAHTRHYMPVPSGSVEKSAKVLDGFLAVDPEAELIVWWEVGLNATANDALAAAARGLSYLGRSESVCTARLVTGAGPDDVSAAPRGSLPTTNTDVETIDLLCLKPGEPFSSLTTNVTDLRKGRQLAPPGTRRITYEVRTRRVAGTSPTATPPERPTLALLRIRGGNRPGITESVALGQLLRSSLQSRFGGGRSDATSPTFSGRAGDRPRSDQHRHAHYISLPDEHGRRIDQLVVWAPEGLGPSEIAGLAGLQNLAWRKAGHDRERGEPLEVALGALGHPDDLVIPKLLGPSREWTSLTPFGLVRHPKIRSGRTVDGPEDQVRRELAHRNFPPPKSVEPVGGQWHRFRSSKAGASRLGRASLAGIKIGFAEEVRGPIALGALSHYGLGLMTPAE